MMTHRVMLRRMRTALGAMAVAVIALPLAVVALTLTAPLAPAQAVGPDRLPFTVTNQSQRGEEVFLYVVGVNLQTGRLGYVSQDGAFTPWPAGSNPPSPAPDVSIRMGGSGSSTTVHVPRGFSGRLYMSFGERLPFKLTPDGLVQPAPWAAGDPSRDILFDWSEFTYNDAGLWLNSSQVDMFAVPHSVSVTGADGATKTTGELVSDGRNRVIDGIRNQPGWSGLVQTRGDGTVLRVLAPGKAADTGQFDPNYLDPYITSAWNAYASKTLAVVPFGDRPDVRYYGRTSGNDMRFTDGSGNQVASFAKPSTSNVWGCDGALGAPNDQVVGPIARTLCAALHRSTLGRIDTQPSGGPADFYQGAITNHYSRLIHQNMVDGKAYGFAFDDVLAQESLVHSGDPRQAGITLTPFGSSGTTTPPAELPTSDNPDLGPNVKVFDPSTPTATIQGAFDTAFNDQLLSPTAQFGTQRHAFLFKPGTYGRVWANLGFYTSVAGLGLNPDDVTINGAINVDSGWNHGDERNATQNFWRSAENLAIVPEGGTNRWAVSQAAPMRRVHVRGNFTMGPSNQDHGQGYSSGGYLADSVVDGTVSSGSQQQWYTRDSRVGSWEGGVWNMVFSGVQGAPPQAFPNPPHTTLPTTPRTREKPYLYVDGAGDYRVFVPSLRRDSAGPSWPDTPGTSIPMREFYVVREGDSAQRINTALSEGLNLFFTPGTYPLDQTIRVTRPSTVVTGIGYPTLVPQNGIEAMNVADADGINISGLTFDAGTTNSPTLMSVGVDGVHADHADNPISLQDVFFRIGSSIQGKATTTLAVHADDTIIDHIWAWRADHGGAPTGWNANTGDTGLLVTGDDVLATGLFVEHYQKYEVIWNGNRGRTIFFQNEKPYDVPDQASWMGPRGNGYAAYKVGDHVTDHELWGGGVYCFFNANPGVRVDRGFEVPNRAGVRLHDVLTVSLGDVGTIGSVVNDVGGSVPNPAGSTVPRNVVSYP